MVYANREDNFSARDAAEDEKTKAKLYSNALRYDANAYHVMHKVQ